VSNSVEKKAIKDKEFWKLVGVMILIAFGVLGILSLVWWLVIDLQLHP